MRHALIGLLVMLATVAAPASAQVSFAYSGPGISIGINVPTYPVLHRIPNYPVYYAPSLHTNYFFYDGVYWVYDGGTWYESPWYNGPWYAVDPYNVPVYILRVPVRYYQAPPVYFRSWAYDAPPRWGDHWGTTWASSRAGWDRWNRSSVPAAAPLPTYQRAYTGSRYPLDVAQQAAIQVRSYSYTPRETVVRQRFQERRAVARTAAPVSAGTRATTTQGTQRNAENMRRQEQRFAEKAEQRTGRAAENARRQQEHFAQKQLDAQQRAQRQQDKRTAQVQRREDHRAAQAQRQQEHRAAQVQRQEDHRAQQAQRKQDRQEDHRAQQAQRKQDRQDQRQARGKGHDKEG